jgi:hypothetical protein
MAIFSLVMMKRKEKRRLAEQKATNQRFKYKLHPLPRLQTEGTNKSQPSTP